MQKLVETQDIERELRATLSAQREIGPNYDHHLVEAFMQKLHQQPHQQPVVPLANQTQLTPGVTAGMRLALAILSVIFLIPLSAIAISNGGLAALVVVGLVVLGINVAFNRRH